MCRSASNGQSGRRCKKVSHMSQEEKEKYNARRRELYQENKVLAQNYEKAHALLKEKGVRTILPGEMDTQKWFSPRKTEFNRDHQNPIDVLPAKPGNAMWTSPSTGEGKSEWTDYNAYDMGSPSHGYLIDVKPSKHAVIVEVSTEEDLQALYNAYPKKSEHSFMCTLDYEKMKEDGIQAVHSSVNPNDFKIDVGQGDDNKSAIFYGWDLPSTAWLDKRIVKVGKHNETDKYENVEKEYGYGQEWDDYPESDANMTYNNDDDDSYSEALMRLREKLQGKAL